jgi:hypothetical protein
LWQRSGQIATAAMITHNNATIPIKMIIGLLLFRFGADSFGQGYELDGGGGSDIARPTTPC